MSYNDPLNTRTYYLGSITFTTSDKVFVIDVQPNENITILDVEARITTQGGGATTTPRIRIGDGSTVNRYFDWDLGTTAATNSVLRSNTPANRSRFTAAAAAIAKGQDLTITCAAATGAGAAGVADVWVTVNRW